MRNKVFNEIYDQFTPDEAVVNELFGRLETAKPKAVPFKPIMAVMGAAAVIALSFGVTKLIPDDPIDVAFNPSLTTTSTSETIIPAASVTTTKNEITTSHDILTSESETDLPQETTTTPVITEETTTSSITTAPCYGPGVTSTTAVTTTTTTPVVTTTTTPVVTTTTTPVVTTTTTATTDEIIATTTTTSTLTSEDVTTEEVITEEEEEEVIEEEDTEVAEEDMPELKPLPEFKTLSEYVDFLGLSDTAHIGYESYFTIGDTKFLSFTTKDFDFGKAEIILSLSANAQLNPDAPRKDGEERLNYYRLTIDDKFIIDFYENGTMEFNTDTDSGYLGYVLFSGDTAAYEMLNEYVEELKGEQENKDIPVSDETEVGAEEESMPEEDESEESAVTTSEEQ